MPGEGGASQGGRRVAEGRGERAQSLAPALLHRVEWCAGLTTRRPHGARLGHGHIHNPTPTPASSIASPPPASSTPPRNMLNWDAQTHMPRRRRLGPGRADGGAHRGLRRPDRLARRRRRARPRPRRWPTRWSRRARRPRRDAPHAMRTPPPCRRSCWRPRAAPRRRCRRSGGAAKPENDWAAFEPGFAEVLAPHPRDRPGQGRGAGDDALRRPDRRLRPRRRRGDDRPDLRRAGGLPAGRSSPRCASARRRWPDADPVRRRRRSSSRRRCRTSWRSPSATTRTHFRIDAAPHPFSVPHSPGDVRFTTRYDVDNPQFAIARHAARGGARDVRVQPAARLRLPARRHGARDDGAREPVAVAGEDGGPQPRVPRLAGAADGRRPSAAMPARWSLANVLNAWRRLDDGFIRVEADELSYPLHVILRYRLEQALIAGDLLPRRRAGRLGRAVRRSCSAARPPDLAHGCLQDIHWAAGLIGYFPNYAMGSMLAAQLFERANADDPEILPALGRGDFKPYFAWVKPRVHERASLVDFAALVARRHRRAAERRRLQAPRQEALPGGGRALEPGRSAARFSRPPSRPRSVRSSSARRPGASWPSPGAAAAAGSGCGAQPVRVMISKVAATRPSARRSARRRSRRRGPARRGSAAGRAPSTSTLVSPMARRSADQRQRVVVAHGDPVDVGHRQGEAGALQQAGGVEGVGERRDARAGAAAHLELGRRSAPGAARSGSRRRGSRRGTGRPASAPGGSGSARPTKSLAQCSASDETTRSRLAAANGSRSSSATHARRRPARQHRAGEGRSRPAAPTLAAASLRPAPRAKAPSRAPRSTASGKLAHDRLQPLDEVLGRAALQEVAARSRAAARSRRRRCRARSKRRGGPLMAAESYSERRSCQAEP